MKKLYLFSCMLAALVAEKLRPSGLRTANSESSAGTHEMGIVTRLSSAAHPSRYLLVKAGADDDHVVLCDAVTPAVGYTDDMPMEAEDAINVQLPGAIKGTRKVIAVAALTEYADIYQAANGQVQGEPVGVGVYYKVGRSVRASAQSVDGLYYTEAVLHAPQRMVVLAHNAQFTDLANALNGSVGALVKILTS